MEHHGFDFSRSAIIAPPSAADARATRTNYLFVDSRDREFEVYPCSSHYVIEYDDPFRDVVSAELVYARVALSRNNVDESTCEFAVVVGPDTFPIVLPTGYFRPQEVCDRINVVLSSTTSGVVASFDADSQKFVFASSVASFALDLSSRRSSTALLGFHSTVRSAPSVQQPSGGEWRVVSDYPYVPTDKVNDYAIMIIDNFGNIKSSNNAANNAFAVIDQDTSARSGEGMPIAKKYFNPPLNDLGRLKVKFVDRHNRPYSFAKEDHYFVLKLECLKNGRKYGW